MGRGRFQPAFQGLRGFPAAYKNAVRWTYIVTDKAQYKFNVLIFWDKHGLEAMMDAFKISRRTLFLWKN